MEAARPPLESTAGGRRLGLLTALLVAVGLVLVAAVGYVLYERYLARPAIPPLSGTPVEVRRASVESLVSANGSVALSKYSKLGMSVGGRIKELPVRSGDDVKAGAVLARLETTPLELRLAQARSQLRTAQRRARRHQEPVPDPRTSPRRRRPSRARRASSPTSRAAACRRTSPRRRRRPTTRPRWFARLRRGSTACATARRQADISAAEQSLKAAQANVDKAAADLASIKTPSEEELAPLRINVEKAEAAVRTARANFDKFAWRPDIAPRAPSRSRSPRRPPTSRPPVAALMLKQQPRQTDVDAAQRAVDSAQAQVAAAQARIDQLHAGPTAEDVRAAQAAVDGARRPISSPRRASPGCRPAPSRASSRPPRRWSLRRSSSSP